MSEDREDIRANVLGLRTFRLPRERSGPWISPVAISKDSTWEKGEAVARCQKCGDNVPGKNCYCGLHAYLTYGDLRGEYRVPSEHVVAVVRAEGKVWEHERGWRASEAYVEAIYLSDLARVSLEAKGFGDAPKESGIPIHSDLKAMLAEYGFDHESAARRRRPTPSIADSHFFWGLAGTPDWRAAHPGVRIRTGARSFFLFIALMVVLMVLGMTVFEFCWPRVMANPTTNVWESPYSWPLMAAAGLVLWMSSRFAMGKVARVPGSLFVIAVTVVISAPWSGREAMSFLARTISYGSQVAYFAFLASGILLFGRKLYLERKFSGSSSDEDAK